MGSSRFVYDVWGQPLNLVRVLVQSAEANEIRVTETIYRQLGPDSGFSARPPIALPTMDELASFGRFADPPAAGRGRRPAPERRPHEAAR